MRALIIAVALLLALPSGAKPPVKSKLKATVTAPNQPRLDRVEFDFNTNIAVVVYMTPHKGFTRFVCDLKTGTWTRNDAGDVATPLSSDEVQKYVGSATALAVRGKR